MAPTDLDYFNLKRSHETQVYETRVLQNVLLKIIKLEYHKIEVHISKTKVLIFNGNIVHLS